MPTLDLTLQETAPPLVFTTSVDVGFRDNIQAGVIPYGDGYVKTVLSAIRAGVKYSSSVPVLAEVPAATIAPPTTPLALHIGQGTVFLTWGHPTPEQVDYYELLASASETGVYEKYQAGEFTALHGWVQNIPLGATAYFRLRAIGLNGAVSGLVQVKLGKLDPNAVYSLQGRAIQGSIIPVNATFTVPHPETGNLITMQCVAETVFT